MADDISTDFESNKCDGETGRQTDGRKNRITIATISVAVALQSKKQTPQQLFYQNITQIYHKYQIPQH